ncbi:MAG: hypothetical protein QNJ26_07565 [Desulfobacterales bacterium]|nr:hypothetical protein [Desulfobacterales bacterium]
MAISAPRSASGKGFWQPKGGSSPMDVSRKLGILVFYAVPAIIGGGVVFHFSGGSWLYVFIYEILLLLTAGGFITK